MQKIGKFSATSGLLAGITAAVCLMARSRRRRTNMAKPAEPGKTVSPDLVEEASMESFPASDSPSWTVAALP